MEVVTGDVPPPKCLWAADREFGHSPTSRLVSEAHAAIALLEFWRHGNSDMETHERLASKFLRVIAAVSRR